MASIPASWTRGLRWLANHLKRTLTLDTFSDATSAAIRVHVSAGVTRNTSPPSHAPGCVVHRAGMAAASNPTWRRRYPLPLPATWRCYSIDRSTATALHLARVWRTMFGVALSRATASQTLAECLRQVV